jgi:hypothetical protein
LDGLPTPSEHLGIRRCAENPKDANSLLCFTFFRTRALFLITWVIHEWGLMWGVPQTLPQGCLDSPIPNRLLHSEQVFLFGIAETVREAFMNGKTYSEWVGPFLRESLTAGGHWTWGNS